MAIAAGGAITHTLVPPTPGPLVIAGNLGVNIGMMIMVGAILLTISVPAFGNLRSRYAVREARNAFSSLQARARAQAIEFGQIVEFHVDASGDSMWIERNDTTLETVRLMTELGVGISASSSSYTLCMSPRGYADEDCNSFNSNATFAFGNGADTTKVTMTTLGLLKY